MSDRRIMISRRAAILAALLVLQTLLVRLHAQEPVIAVFGSSVAKGSGDTTTQAGYAGLFSNMMATRGWKVVNVSRGGDNTGKLLARFETDLLPVKPRYVLIGLSLGNEGIANATETARARTMEKFRSNLVRLIRMCRANGIEPAVVNCYTRNDFGEIEYSAVREMNHIIQTWDVPSVNVLGTIDDGAGRWAPGYWKDRAHPNDKGHREMFLSIVPSLFDAMKAGKQIPEKVRSNRCMESDGSGNALSFIPDDSVHAFSFSFMVKCSEPGMVGDLIGKHRTISIVSQKGGIAFYSGDTLLGSGDTTTGNKGWQYVTVSHRHALGATFLFLDGRQLGQVNGPFLLKEIRVGGAGNPAAVPSARARFREVMIHRSSLNPSEVLDIYHGCLLQSSLEVYAPLDDTEFLPGVPVKNLAQSFSKLIPAATGMKPAVE